MISDSPEFGHFAWHDGGNAWSFGLLARLLEEDAMVFWITNRVRNADEDWNLVQIGQRLTAGVAERIAG